MKNYILKVVMFISVTLPQLQAQVAIGTNNPDSSAIFQLESTTKGFLPPRLTDGERNSISSPAIGLTIYNTTIKCLEVFNGSGWQNLCDGTVVGVLITSGACIGEPEFFTFNGLVYRPIESGPSNAKRCWLDRNLGATQVAAQSNDSQSYGDLYQWGRGSDGHQSRNPLSSTSSTQSSSTSPGNSFIIGSDNWYTGSDPNLWGLNGTNNPCPSGYRVPSSTEWTDEFNSWGWSNQSAAGALASPLKLPMGGYREKNNGSLTNVGISADYWTNEVTSSTNATTFYFVEDPLDPWGSYPPSIGDVRRANGLAIRCIKN